ncbi:MAG: malonyl-ACP O-methyltransferase BioC [Marinicellaceae bacterium]
MPLEYHAILKSFNNAANQYEENAVLQKEVMSRLIERLDDECKIDPTFQPNHILDLGCGTGWAIPKFLKLFNNVKISALDFSKNMLEHISHHKQVNVIHSDVHDLPFEDNAFDVVFSNMLIHWCNEKDVFAECMRVLKPNGLLIMSALGETSLVELKQSWLSVDKQMHVHDFPALHDMGDTLLKLGFEEPVVNAEIITLTYKDIISLMRDIKSSGGHNVIESRKKGLMTRKQLNTLMNAYEEFRVDDRLPASYEVVYLRAKKSKKINDISLAIKD